MTDCAARQRAARSSRHRPARPANRKPIRAGVRGRVRTLVVIVGADHVQRRAGRQRETAEARNADPSRPRPATRTRHRREPSGSISQRPSRSLRIETSMPSAVARRLVGAAALRCRASASLASLRGVDRSDVSVGTSRASLRRDERASRAARRAARARALRAARAAGKAPRGTAAIANRGSAWAISASRDAEHTAVRGVRRRAAQSRCAALRSRPAPSLRSSPPNSFLNRRDKLAALGLARFFLFAGQPRDLDHAALALVRQMAVERVVGAPERGQRAVQRPDLRRGEIVDVVDAVQESEAAVAGVGPRSR